MENSLFRIVLTNGKTVTTKTVTTDSLHKIFDNFIRDKGYCLCITSASVEDEKTKIQKYYNSQYYFFNKRYKLNQITKEEFTQVINKLKEIKNNNETFEEIETKFNEYKKTLTIIPPYNVSE